MNGNVERGMTSPPLDSTHGRQRQAWHDDITAFGQHTQSNDVGRGMTSQPLECTHNWQRRAWHDITTLGQMTQSSTLGVAGHYRPGPTHTIGNVGSGMTSPPLDSTHGQQRRAWHDISAFGHHRRSDVRRDMPSPLWTAHTIERHRAWHAIIAFGQHTRSNDV